MSDSTGLPILSNCDCDNYSDLGLDLEKIGDRVHLFREMRLELKQIGTKLVERWLEHYRLYRCEQCGQYWQASLAPRDSDTWYLYKVPKVPVAKWKQAPYVPPHEIVHYIGNREAYISNNFDLRDKQCRTGDCQEFAIGGLQNCHYHQWMEIEGSVYRDWFDRLTWYSPYSPDMLKYRIGTQLGTNGI